MSDRYVRPLLEQSLLSSRERVYEIGEVFKFTVPVFHFSELEFATADLREVAKASSTRGNVEATIVMLRDTGGREIEVPDLGFPVYVDYVDTPRLVLSLTLWIGNIYLPSYLDRDRADELRETLNKLGMKPFSTLDELLSSYRNRVITRLVGAGRHTRYLYSKLRDNLDGAHYGFREPIDLEIVKELPKKFEYITEKSELNFIPIRNLSKYPGRVSRQYVVGDLYGKPYFEGGSVLDVGCDIRGISERIGEATKYVGVDIQGLGDYLLDLDKEDLPFEPRSFDTVVCFEVLEHLNRIHALFDQMLEISDSYFVGSLYIESGNLKGRSINHYGDPLGNMNLPIAPVFDRHEWIFSITDALDFIYYRARKKGFKIVRTDFYYDDLRPQLMQLARLRRAVRRGDVRYLSKEILMIGFVLARDSD
jgi:SAM-dependent methyltransferase